MADPSDELANMDLNSPGSDNHGPLRGNNVRTSRLASAPNLVGYQPSSPMGAYRTQDAPLGRSLSISSPDQHIDAEDFRLHAVRRFAIDKSKEKQAIKQVRRRIAGSMPNIHVNQHLEGGDPAAQTIDTVQQLLDDLAEDHPDSHVALDHLQWVCDQLGLKERHATKRNSVAYPRAPPITEGSEEEEEEEEMSLEDMQQDMIQDADIPAAEVV
eukprot:CAMPEP_0184302748 /NCGR_PEP_ID=MMETSP1049-20130417/12641_1 /TAXON_ID=77928 /ORGANISM="Proteomonas sulcata, Strain CCMP704" /LENGTH=212 /DNA_ID=CAMNT_0026614095 /DNA_START=331 /DNA_END=969 /DNA_ORIENTATION=+